MQWFKHMSNMQHDVKIQRVIDRYGLEGYGLYNAILEMIVRNLETKRPLPDLEERAEDVARQFNGDTARINEMMAFMVNQGLFEIEEIKGRVVCHNVYKYLDAAQTRSKEIREMISSYKTGLNGNNSATILVTDNVTDNDEEKKRIEEKRTEHADEEPSNEYEPCGDFVYLRPSEYKELCGTFSAELIVASIRAMNIWVREKKDGKCPWRQVDGKYGGKRAVTNWLERDGYTAAKLKVLHPYIKKGYSLAEAKQLYSEGTKP